MSLHANKYIELTKYDKKILKEIQSAESGNSV